MSQSRHVNIRKKLTEWLKRYGPIEGCSLVISLAVSSVINQITGRSALAAVIGTTSGALLYYGFNAIREFAHHYRQRKHQRMSTILAHACRDVIIEFGIGGVLDICVVRPFMMVYAARITPWLALNVLIGKIIADGIYYAFAISGYEVKRRCWRRKDQLPAGGLAFDEPRN